MYCIELRACICMQDCTACMLFARADHDRKSWFFLRILKTKRLRSTNCTCVRSPITFQFISICSDSMYPNTNLNTKSQYLVGHYTRRTMTLRIFKKKVRHLPNWEKKEKKNWPAVATFRLLTSTTKTFLLLLRGWYNIVVQAQLKHVLSSFPAVATLLQAQLKQTLSFFAAVSTLLQQAQLKHVSVS